VTGSDGERVAGGQLDQLVVVSGTPHEARAGGFAEREPEPQMRRGSGQGLVEVFDGLDEVRLPQDEVQVVGLVDRH
jgi:hypothetical protein